MDFEKDYKVYQDIRSHLKESAKTFESAFLMQVEELVKVQKRLQKKVGKLTDEQLLLLSETVPHFIENHEIKTNDFGRIWCTDNKCWVYLYDDEVGLHGEKPDGDKYRCKITQEYLRILFQKPKPRLYAGKCGWVQNLH